MARIRALLFGRRTYQVFILVLAQPAGAEPVTEVLNRTQKHVASTTLEEPLSWSNSMLLKGTPPKLSPGFGRSRVTTLVILGRGELPA